MNISDFVILLGGVAMFLFGMALMGDGLKKVAGSKLELILYRLSNTTPKGILLGAGVTAIIQSSSATSVMVVGFVNSEMMKVRQAIPVIMGAIIGTSITGWVICLSELGSGASGVVSLLSTSSISAAAAIIGILLRMAAKNKTARNVGDILMGFAVLMFGMKTMSSSVSGLKESPLFISLIVTFKNPLIGILVGLVFTAILQSASATVGILQALSVTGVITFDIALPMIMGIAIGASVPVMISAVGSTTNGKRTAFSYPVIEICRVVIFSLVFYTADALFCFGFTSDTMDMAKIAALNTVFRVSTIIILAPFSGAVEKLTKLLFKRSPEEIAEFKEMNRLEPRFLAYPPLAIEQSRLAMNNMAQVTKKSIYAAQQLLFNYSEKDFNEIKRMESVVDRYEDKIGNYLMQLTGHDMTPQQSAQVTKYLHVLSDFERMSDHALNLAESAQEISEKSIAFSLQGREEIDILSAAVGEEVASAVKGFADNNIDAAFRSVPLREVINNICEDMKDHHIESLRKGEYQMLHGYVLTDLITGFERIAAHCSNIAMTTIEINENTIATHEYERDIRRSRAAEYEELMDYYEDKYSVAGIEG